jgi:hypothetical protein
MHGDGESPRAVVAGNGKSEDEKRREQCFFVFCFTSHRAGRELNQQTELTREPK